MSNDQNKEDEYRGGEEQPWREQRNEPEPLAIEGQHAGRNVAEEKQRPTRADSGVGDISRPDGRGSGGGDPEHGGEGLSSGSAYGDSGSHQGTSTTPYGRSGNKHASGHGRSTEGAFGEETAQENANPLNDIRDSAISKREIGPSGTGERTQGGHS